MEKVIARMLEEVPPGIPREDELPPAEDEFADALRRLRKSVAVASSEMLSFWRREVQRLLNDCIPRDDADQNDWQRLVMAIWEDLIEREFTRGLNDGH